MAVTMAQVEDQVKARLVTETVITDTAKIQALNGPLEGFDFSALAGGPLVLVSTSAVNYSELAPGSSGVHDMNIDIQVDTFSPHRRNSESYRGGANVGVVEIGDAIFAAIMEGGYLITIAGDQKAKPSAVSANPNLSWENLALCRQLFRARFTL